MIHVAYLFLFIYSVSVSQLHTWISTFMSGFPYFIRVKTDPFRNSIFTLALTVEALFSVTPRKQDKIWPVSNGQVLCTQGYESPPEYGQYLR